MIEKLVARLIGDGSSYRKMIDAASKQSTRFVKTVGGINKQLKSMGQSATRLGKSISLAVTLPLVGIGATAVNEFSKFDQAMTKSTAIMQVTDNQTKRLRDTALELSKGSTKSATELAESYFFLASAGLNAEQSIAALPQVTKFASAGAFDMALATELLTDAQSALGLSSKDTEQNLKSMARVSDVLVKANTLANASVQQFSESLTNTAGATLKNFNKELEEGVAVLAAYADQGVKANVAGTNLTRVTLFLQRAVKTSSDAHRELGFSVFDAQGKMNSYANILSQLEEITEGMSDETKAATLSQLGFATEMQNALLPLIGMSDQIKEYERELRRAGGTTEDVADKQIKSFANQMAILKNQAIAASIALGESLAPIVLVINKTIRALTRVFNSLSPSMKTTIATVVGLVAAAGPLLVIIGSVINALTTLGPIIVSVGGTLLSFLNPVTAVIGVIALLAGSLRMLGGSWENAGNIAKNAFDFMVDHAILAIRVISRSITAFAAWAAVRFKEMWSVDFVKAVIRGIKIASQKAGTAVVDFGKFTLKKLRAVFTGEETGTFEDFLAGISSDLERGARNRNLLDSVREIIGEEQEALKRRRSGDTILPTEIKEPLETKVSQTKDKSFDFMKGMAGDMKQLVDIGKKQLAKEGVELAPLGL